MNSSSKKLIIIVLDGATFDLINPLIKQGKLPNIAQFISRGSSGILKSIIPPSTIPVAPSIITGKNPGKHGVFDFMKINDEGLTKITSRLDIKTETIFDILKRYEKHTISINFPCTYPPQKIKGIMVSGMLTPSGRNFAQPQSIEELLNKITDGYRIEPDTSLLGKKSGTEELIKDIYRVTKKQKKAFFELLRRYKWDVSMIFFRGTVYIEHLFWDNQKIVNNFYQFMDKVIGETQTLFPGATIFIMSDHGQQTQYKDLHINKWLLDNGFTVIKKNPSTKSRLGQKICIRLGLTKKNLEQIIPTWILKKVKKIIPHSIKSHLPKNGFPFSQDYEINWQKTKASAYQLFGLATNAIKINPCFYQTEKEYKKLRENIVASIKKIRDPQSGDRIILWAYFPEDIFSGPFTDKAPDITLRLKDGYNITNTFFARDTIVKRPIVRGCNHRDGIFLALGKEIKSGFKIDSASILDLVPTILHFLNLPISEDIDGKPLKMIFT